MLTFYLNYIISSYLSRYIRKIAHLPLPKRTRSLLLCKAKDWKTETKSVLVIFSLAPYHWWIGLSPPYEGILQWSIIRSESTASRNRNLGISLSLNKMIISSRYKGDIILSFHPFLISSLSVSFFIIWHWSLKYIYDHWWKSMSQ